MSKNKTDCRRRMHAAYIAEKISSAAASALKATMGLPSELAWVVVAMVMARAAAAAKRIPVKVFRYDRPEVDRRRVKVLGGGGKVV